LYQDVSEVNVGQEGCGQVRVWVLPVIEMKEVDALGRAAGLTAVLAFGLVLVGIPCIASAHRMV
jgi:hypothetical protein